MTPEEEIALQRRRRAALLRDPDVRQAVARLKVNADASLGYESPQWVRDLAEEVLDPRLPEPRWVAARPRRRRTAPWWRRPWTR